jgi:hypothetical protein
VVHHWTGFHALTLAGELVFVDDDVQPPRAEPETELMWLVIALVGAAARYPALGELRPTRPSARADCHECNGTGKLTLVGRDLRCGTCAALGWIAHDPSELGLLV